MRRADRRDAERSQQLRSAVVQLQDQVEREARATAAKLSEQDAALENISVVMKLIISLHRGALHDGPAKIQSLFRGWRVRRAVGAWVQRRMAAVKDAFRAQQAFLREVRLQRRQQTSERERLEQLEQAHKRARQQSAARAVQAATGRVERKLQWEELMSEMQQARQQQMERGRSRLEERREQRRQQAERF